MDRHSRWSNRSKRLEFRFTVAVHAPITVQPQFFQFPRRNVRLGISLSTDVSAFSRAPERNVRINISLSSDFGAFSTARESLAGTIWHLRTVHSLASFLILSIPCVAFSKGKERRIGEGLLGDNYNRTVARGLGGLSLRSALQHFLPLRLHRRRACALCKALSMQVTCKRKEDTASY